MNYQFRDSAWAQAPVFYAALGSSTRRSRRHRLIGAFIALFWTAILAACGGGQKTLKTLSLQPAQASLKLGRSEQLRVTAIFSDGSKSDATTQATFSSSNSAVAKPGSTPGREGFVTALGAGNAVVTASLSGETATSQINVSDQPSRLAFILYKKLVGTSLELPVFDNTIVVAAIDPSTGNLSPLNSFFLGTTDNSIFLEVDPLGRFLYVQQSTLKVFKPDLQSGNLTLASTSELSVCSASVFVPDPLGRFLYKPCTSGQRVGMGSFRIDSNGTVTLANQFTPAGIGSFLGTNLIEPGGKFVYGWFVTGNTASDQQLFGLEVDSSGSLSAVSGSPFPVSFPGGITPDGRFLYAVECCPIGLSPEPVPQGANSVSAINAQTGALSIVSTTPSLINPLIHPNGRFLYSQNKDGIHAFAIDSASGALAEISGSPFQFSPTATSWTMEPSGHFLYGISGPNIVLVAIDSASGALRFVVTNTPSTQAGSPSQIKVLP